MLKKIILSLAIGWTFLIVVLCLVRFSDLPTVKVSGADKYVHFTFHLVFTLLWGYYCQLHQSYLDKKSLIRVVLASLFLGVIIEFLQENFTTTRHADVLDVLANCSGAMTAVLIFYLMKRGSKA